MPRIEAPQRDVYTLLFFPGKASNQFCRQIASHSMPQPKPFWLLVSSKQLRGRCFTLDFLPRGLVPPYGCLVILSEDQQHFPVSFYRWQKLAPGIDQSSHCCEASIWLQLAQAATVVNFDAVDFAHRNPSTTLARPEARSPRMSKEVWESSDVWKVAAGSPQKRRESRDVNTESCGCLTGRKIRKRANCSCFPILLWSEMVEGSRLSWRSVAEALRKSKKFPRCFSMFQ